MGVDNYVAHAEAHARHGRQPHVRGVVGGVRLRARARGRARPEHQSGHFPGRFDALKGMFRR